MSPLIAIFPMWYSDSSTHKNATLIEEPIDITKSENFNDVFTGIRRIKVKSVNFHLRDIAIPVIRDVNMCHSIEAEIQTRTRLHDIQGYPHKDWYKV